MSQLDKWGYKLEVTPGLLFKISFAVLIIGITGSLFIFNSRNKTLATDARQVTSPFYYNFSWSGQLEEAASESLSRSPYWWLNSGGRMYFEEGVGKTIQGSLGANDYWRILYSTNNPTDTDNGYHPQNIFRLLTRGKWQNFEEQAHFLINRDSLSSSPNRNASNGLLFFQRYLDGDNTYYSGIRVDGAAVIRKKIKGQYYTLAYRKIFEGTYDRSKNPNLLPKNKWLGLRSGIATNNDGTVSVTLYLDKEGNGRWSKILEAKDDGKSSGGAPILGDGFAGMRTDFMDVSFDNYLNTKTD